MKKFILNRKVAAAAGIALVVGASVTTRSGSALPTPESSPQPEGVTLEREFSDFVHGALEKNAQSQSLEEWEASGFTPADILANARARRASKDAALRALCGVLSTLDEQSLALFQNELADPKIQAELACALPLHARLEAYWNASRVALQFERDQAHLARGLSHLSADSLTGPDETVVPQLPSDEVHIDASKGETLYGLPREGYLKENEIAITIDDGPHPTITRKVLNTLKAYGVRANFFSVGRPAKVWPELDRAEIEEGHITGSHSMTHPMMPSLPVATAEAEILNGRKAVAEAAGVDIPFFRFPYGGHNSVLDAFVKKQELTSFLWNMDSSDWKLHSPVDLFHNEVAQLNAARGGIMLMHDIHEQTAIALPHLLDELYHRGWKTVVFIPH